MTNPLVVLDLNRCMYSHPWAPFIVSGAVLGALVIHLVIRTWRPHSPWAGRSRRFVIGMLCLTWIVVAVAPLDSYRRIAIRDVQSGAPQRSNATFYHKYFRTLYTLSTKIRASHPAPCRVRMVSGHDLKADPWQSYFYHLQYFLYPLDISEPETETYDCMFVLDKAQAASYLPQGFDVVYRWDDRTFFAVRKQ